MDFSSCINFDELEDKTEPTEKLQTRRFSLKVSATRHLANPTHKKSQTFYNSKQFESPSSHPYIKSSPFTKQVRKNPSKPDTKQTSRFFAFEGKKLMLSSLSTFSSFEVPPLAKLPNKNMSPTNLRLSNKNFRSYNLTPGKLRSKSFWTGKESGERKLTEKKKTGFRVRVRNGNRRMELIPQTKACGIKKGKEIRPELRISGVVKDFVCREVGGVKVRDSGDATDEIQISV